MSNPFNLLPVNLPMCDYVTFTSWRKDGFSHFEDTCWLPSESEPESRMNYKGKRYATMFLGDGVQNGHWHRCLMVSGSAADEVLPLVLDVEEHWTNTRLDLQVTCDWPNNDLFGLASELVRVHGVEKVNFRSSASGQTVYLGSRSSDKFARIYNKSHRLVRFEVQYKKNYSDGMARQMINMGDDGRKEYMRAWLRWELTFANSPTLDRVFGAALAGNSTEPVRMVNREESDRERWIRKVVVPCLEKYTNSHDADPNLIDHIVKVLTKWDGESDAIL